MSAWTPEETAQLKTLVAKGVTDLIIAKRMCRTKNAIQCKRNKIIGSFAFCLDCGVKVRNIKGRRLRCVECATKRTNEQKKQRAATWYQSNKDLKRTERDRIRFAGNREMVIQRDNERCANCGISRSAHYLKYNTDLTVDHIDGNGRNSVNQNNSPKNLKTLCYSCKGKKDVTRRKKDWSMCASNLKRYRQEQIANRNKSVSELLIEGKTPGNKNGYWK